MTEDLPSYSNCSPFARHEYAIAAGLHAASGFVSLLASCFVIFLIVLFKKWRFFTQRLVLYLATSVALLSITATVIRVDYNNETSDFYVRFCQFSAFALQNTSWMELMAVASITLYIFECAFFSKRTDRFEPVYLFFIFAFPLLFNWIPFINKSYGRAGAWCWIRNQEYLTCERFVFGQVLQFVLWYVPIYVILIILIGLYVTVLIKIHWYDRHKWTGSYKLEDEHHDTQMSKEIRSLLRYPLIYFIANLFPLFNRIHGLARPNYPNLALWILAAILFPLQGGFMALAFTLDSDTRRRLKWVHIKAAAKELCQKTGNDIKEYPIQHLSAPDERIHNSRYHALDESGVRYVEEAV